MKDFSGENIAWPGVELVSGHCMGETDTAGFSKLVVDTVA